MAQILFITFNNNLESGLSFIIITINYSVLLANRCRTRCSEIRSSDSSSDNADSDSDSDVAPLLLPKTKIN